MFSCVISNIFYGNEAFFKKLWKKCQKFWNIQQKQFEICYFIFRIKYIFCSTKIISIKLLKILQKYYIICQNKKNIDKYNFFSKKATFLTKIIWFLLFSFTIYNAFTAMEVSLKNYEKFPKFWNIFFKVNK